jgi:RHS repeat-associated protein
MAYIGGIQQMFECFNGPIFTGICPATGSYTVNVHSGGTILVALDAYTTIYSQSSAFINVGEVSHSVTFTVTGDPWNNNLGNSGPSPSRQPNALTGEPVSVTSGAFYENLVDLHVNGPLPIEVRRTYSSLNTGQMNEFGSGWLSGYSSYLIPATDGSTIQAADTDGSVIVFRQQSGSTTAWAPILADNPGLTNSSGGAANPFNSTIVLTGAGLGATYQWKLPDGSVRNYVVNSFPITVNGAAYTRQRPYLTTWADNRGNTLTFTYGTVSTANDYGLVNQIQSSNGSSVSFTYDTVGHILTAVSGDRTVRYTYDPNFGDLTQVQLPDGSIFNYSYDTDIDGNSIHLITRKTSHGGSILQNFYDDSGRVVRQVATVDQANPTSLVATATFDYSVPGQTTVKDAYGNPTVYQYDANGLITKITDPLGQFINQQWYTTTNSSTGAYINSLQTVTDKRGLVTNYKYDAQGNITETDVTGNLTGDPSTAAETATTTAFYNSLNLPVTVTDASGITTKFIYADPSPNHKYLPTEIDTSKGGTVQNGGTLIRTDLLTYIDQSDVNGFSNGLLGTKTVASGSSDQAVTSYTYFSTGFLKQQTANPGTGDPNVVTNFTYTPHGELDTTTDGDGRSTTYTYDGMSRPLTKTVKDENSNTLGVWNMTYTGTGQLDTTTGPRTAPANSTQRYYDGGDRLEKEVTVLSQAKTDGSGVVQSTSSATTNYTHDFVGNLVTLVDPLGNTTTMNYDGNDQMLGRETYQGSNTTVPPLRTESFLYEPGGKVSQYTNPLGGVTNTFYTATGQPSEQDNPDGSVLKWRYQTDGRLSQEILRNGSKWTTVYDDINRYVTRTLTTSTGTTLATEISAYDRRGNLTAHLDTEGFVKRAFYDGLDRVKAVAGPASVAGSPQQMSIYYYGASSRFFATVNNLEEVTYTISDALGRLQQTQVLDTSHTAVRTTTYAYSADHNAVLVTEGTGAGAIRRLSWTDTFNRPVITTLGDGSFASNTYDLDGNLLSATDALNQTTNYGYNGLNQLTSQTLPDGTVTNFTSDAAGNPLTRVMANGTLTQEQTYDNAGRKLTEKLYSGSTITRQYGYTYYLAGTPAVGLLQTVTAPRDTITTVYDDFLRPQTITTAGALPETNSTTTYGYDRRNLVTSISQSNGVGPATNISRTYDGYSQLVTETVTLPASGGSGGTTYANETQTWDAAGRRATLNDASSSLPAPLFTYAHRADDLLSQVTLSPSNGSPLNFNFYYGDNGLLTSRVNPFRSMTVDNRDAAGRILQQTQVVASTTPLIENMTWFGNSTLKSYAATRTGTGTWNESRGYNYDSRGQLLSEGFTAGSSPPPLASVLNYTFDGNNPGLGVRLDAKVGTGAPASWETSATPDSLGRVSPDQILIPGQPAATVASAYDADGNVTSRTWTSGVNQALTWDAQGRLIRVLQRDTTGNGFNWIAQYDGLGRRIQTAYQAVTSNAGTGPVTAISSIYDPQVEFLEIGVSVNGAKAWKVYGPDLNGVYGGLQGTGGLEAVVMNSGGAATGIINDYFGNGVATISGGSVTWNTTRVGGYGPLPDSPPAQPLTSITQLASAVSWRGHYIDGTGCYHVGARDYEPISARWMSADPLGFAASTSLYEFCNGDPVNFFDPDGRGKIDPIDSHKDNPNLGGEFTTDEYGNLVRLPNGSIQGGQTGSDIQKQIDKQDRSAQLDFENNPPPNNAAQNNGSPTVDPWDSEVNTPSYLYDKYGITNQQYLAAVKQNLITQAQWQAAAMVGGAAVDSLVNEIRAASAVRAGELTTYQDFVDRSVVGDNLEGHELWQHANLNENGLATTRLSTPASQMNPVLVLDQETHAAVNAAQRSIDARAMTPVQNINANAQILRDLNAAPPDVINAAQKAALNHAAKYGH